MNDLEPGPGLVTVEGEVFSCDSRLTKTGKTIFSFEFTDRSNSMIGKLFLNENQVEDDVDHTGCGQEIQRALGIAD